MNYIAHHGILGQKWGVRRYQNKDGSLTAAGRKRYLNENGSLTEAGLKRYYGTGEENKNFRNKIDSTESTGTENIYGGVKSILEENMVWLKGSNITREYTEYLRKKHLDSFYKKNPGLDWLDDDSDEGMLTYWANQGATKEFEERLIYVNNLMLHEKYGTKRFFDYSINGKRWVDNLKYILKTVDPDSNWYKNMVTTS